MNYVISYHTHRANVNTRAVSLRWIHKGEIIESSEQCITLIHTISEATSSNDGEHECEVSYANGTVTRLSAGTLEVVGECIGRVKISVHVHHIGNCITVYKSISQK